MAIFFFGLTDREYRYSHTIGRHGLGKLGFFQPGDLTIGKEGVIYVVNRSVTDTETLSQGVRIVMTNIDEEFLGEFGSCGEGDGQFIWPASVAQDSQGNVYVSDVWLHRISIFDRTGQFLDRWGTAGSRDGEFRRPSSLAFDRQDHLYITDGANHRVQVFTPDGKFMDKFGAEGNGEGRFNMPWGITIDHWGDVYVADWRNDRVQKFSPDGKFLASFGSSGDQIGQFNRPSDLAVDRDGDIYVADWLNHRVQVFTPQFEYITAFKGDATPSKYAEQQLRANPTEMRMWGLVRDMTTIQRFAYPVAVDVDENGRVIIVDAARCRLQVYVKGEMMLPGYKG